LATHTIGRAPPPAEPKRANASTFSFAAFGSSQRKPSWEKSTSHSAGSAA
jgi:hypothetical protein